MYFSAPVSSAAGAAFSAVGIATLWMTALPAEPLCRDPAPVRDSAANRRPDLVALPRRIAVIEQAADAHLFFVLARRLADLRTARDRLAGDGSMAQKGLERLPGQWSAAHRSHFNTAIPHTG